MSVHIIDEIDQAGARATLDRILQVAFSRALPDRQRRDLGAAAAWLQRLIDQGLLPDPRLAAAVPDRVQPQTERHRSTPEQ
jgi:hypothetical protein